MTKQKLQVTPPQAEALDKYIDFNGNSLKNFFANRENWTTTFASIKDLSLDHMAQAIYVGYEIAQPRFEVGDYVAFFNTNVVEKVLDVRASRVWLSDGKCAVEQHQIRHATPKEIFWAELGRKELDFRVGDVIYLDNGDMFRLARGLKLETNECTLADAIKFYEADAIKYIYPTGAKKVLPNV